MTCVDSLDFVLLLSAFSTLELCAHTKVNTHNKTLMLALHNITLMLTLSRHDTYTNLDIVTIMQRRYSCACVCACCSLWVSTIFWCL